ncbi:MAG: radical SAM protein [Vulcanimicrobiota bacterium]
MRVTLVLTHDCNLNCSYCYTGPKFAHSMPQDVAWRALRLAFQQVRTAPGPHSLSFFGGEPLMRFGHIAEIMRLVRRWESWAGRHWIPKLTTNATLLNEKMLKFFIDYDFRIAFSVDGQGDTQDRYRSFVSGKGSSGVVWRNLKMAAGRLRDPVIHVVLNPDTFRDLPHTVKALTKLGYRDIRTNVNASANWSGVTSGDLSAALACLPRAGLSPRDLPCDFGGLQWAVAPSGNLYPCSRLVADDRRSDVRCGHVQSGPDGAQLHRIAERSRLMSQALGVKLSCGCEPLMPGGVVTPLQNRSLFARALYAREAEPAPVEAD